MTMSPTMKFTLIEARLFLRERMIAIFALALPVVILLALGAMPFMRAHQEGLNGQRVIDIYIPLLVGLALAALALNGLPGALGTYRERGVLRRLSTTPVNPSVVLFAQLLVNLVAAVISIILLIVVGNLLLSVPMPKVPVGYALSVILMAASLLAIGLVIAATAPSGRAAGGIGTLVYLPMLVSAGLWTPGFTPKVLQKVGEFTPLGAGVRAIGDAWFGSWPQPTHLLVMAVYTAVFSFLAVRFFRWE
jgi:ABC-2 type transport system permease protein